MTEPNWRAELTLERERYFRAHVAQSRAGLSAEACELLFAELDRLRALDRPASEPEAKPSDPIAFLKWCEENDITFDPELAGIDMTPKAIPEVSPEFLAAADIEAKTPITLSSAFGKAVYALHNPTPPPGTVTAEECEAAADIAAEQMEQIGHEHELSVIHALRQDSACELEALRHVHQEARELIGEADATGEIPLANLNALRALLWRASIKRQIYTERPYPAPQPGEEAGREGEK